MKNNILNLSKRVTLAVGFLLVLCLLYGCKTGLRVNKIAIADMGKPPTEGLVYFLPKVTYEITANREIKKFKLKDDSTGFDIEIEKNVTVLPKYAMDTSNVYVLKYTELEGSMKDTGLQVDFYENGTLKSFNTNVEDQTGTVIANVLSGGLKIASAFTGVPVSSISALGTGIKGQLLLDAEDYCKKEVLDAIDAIKEIKKEIKKTSAKIMTTKKNIQGLLGDSSQTDKLTKLKKVLKEREKYFTTLNKQLQKNKKVVSDTQVYEISPTLQNRCFVLPADKANRKWFIDDGQKLKDLDKHNNIVFSAVQSDCPISNTVENSTHNGLLYRQPFNAEIMLWSGEKCMKPTLVERKKRLFSKILPVPQFGIPVLLTLDNKAFDSHVFKASFGKTGGMKSFTYNTKSSAAKAAASFNQSMEAAATYTEALRGSEAREIQEETELINAKKDKAAAELELKKAEKELKEFE